MKSNKLKCWLAAVVVAVLPRRTGATKQNSRSIV